MGVRAILNRRTVLAAVAIAAVLGVGSAQAAWPERPVTLIVPWGAGGGTDATDPPLAGRQRRGA